MAKPQSWKKLRNWKIPKKNEKYIFAPPEIFVIISGKGRNFEQFGDVKKIC